MKIIDFIYNIVLCSGAILLAACLPSVVIFFASWGYVPLGTAFSLSVVFIGGLILYASIIRGKNRL